MEIQQLIEKNNLRLRTQEELVAKFDEVQKSGGFLDFRPEVLINYLTFENAKPHLKKDAVEKEWEVIETIEKCVQEFLDYMKFAWGKAEDQRGLSASRSIQKLGMWLWIMNREDLSMILDDDSLYNPYGAPALIEVCDKMGIEVPSSLREFAEIKY